VFEAERAEHPVELAAAKCEHPFVSIKGSPYQRFRRALDTGNGFLALTAAQELPALNLADALSLTCALRDDRQRFQTAAVRWHARFSREVRGVTVDDASLALAALATMENRFAVGATALQELCVAHGRGDLAQVLQRALATRAVH